MCFLGCCSYKYCITIKLLCFLDLFWLFLENIASFCFELINELPEISWWFTIISIDILCIRNRTLIDILSRAHIILLAQLTSAWTILELRFIRNNDSRVYLSSNSLNWTIRYVLFLWSCNWKWRIRVVNFIWEVIDNRYSVCSGLIKNLCAIVDNSLLSFIQRYNSLIIYKTIRIYLLDRSSLYKMLRRRCINENWLGVSDLRLELLSHLWCK